MTVVVVSLSLLQNLFSQLFIFSANKSDRPTQLNLALAWNRCDVAQNYIFTPENEMEWQVS